MAVAQAAFAAAVNSNTSGTSITTASAALTLNNTLFAYLSVGMTGSGTPTVTMSDSAGGSWVQVGSTVQAATSGTGSVGVMIFKRTTYGTGASFTVTATFSAAVVCKVMQTQQFSGTAGSTSTITSATSTTATIPNLTTPAATASGDMYVLAVGTADAGTTLSGWTGWSNATNNATAGTTPSGETMNAKYRAATGAGTTTTGTGNQTANTANNTQVAFVLFQGTPITSVESWDILSIN